MIRGQVLPLSSVSDFQDNLELRGVPAAGAPTSTAPSGGARTPRVDASLVEVQETRTPLARCPLNGGGSLGWRRKQHQQGFWS